jgi:hypothetical protein
MMRIFTSGGSLAAATLAAAGPSITPHITTQMATRMTTMIKAVIALAAPVNFVIPQNWKCQEYTRDQKMIDEATAPRENVGLIPMARLPLQHMYARMSARMVWPIAAPG